MGLRYSAIPGHAAELCKMVNDELSERWGNLRGLQVVTVAFNSISAAKEDEDMIKELQRRAVMRAPGMAGAMLVNAQAEAMQAAARNEGGAMTGFMGFGMAQQAGGANAQDFFSMSQQNQATTAPATDWACACGYMNIGKFCSDCGTPKPVTNSWVCLCGVENQGNFCQECGKTKIGEYKL